MESIDRLVQENRPGLERTFRQKHDQLIAATDLFKADREYSSRDSYKFSTSGCGTLGLSELAAHQFTRSSVLIAPSFMRSYDGLTFSQPATRFE